jgi:hypothetical protein
MDFAALEERLARHIELFDFQREFLRGINWQGSQTGRTSSLSPLSSYRHRASDPSQPSPAAQDMYARVRVDLAAMGIDPGDMSVEDILERMIRQDGAD